MLIERQSGAHNEIKRSWKVNMCAVGRMTVSIRVGYKVNKSEQLWKVSIKVTHTVGTAISCATLGWLRWLEVVVTFGTRTNIKHTPTSPPLRAAPPSHS